MTATPIIPNDLSVAKRVANFLGKWRAARWEPDSGELTTCDHGDYTDGPYWTHGWWMTPRDWSLGIAVTTDEWAERLEFGLTVELGPFAWGIFFHPFGALR